MKRIIKQIVDHNVKPTDLKKRLYHIYYKNKTTSLLLPRSPRQERKKLRSKSPSRASATRAADGRLVLDMDGQTARWAELFMVDSPIGQLHTLDYGQESSTVGSNTQLMSNDHQNINDTYRANLYQTFHKIANPLEGSAAREGREARLSIEALNRGRGKDT
ncbi:hypothetical protein GWK47_017641 [Chionoecetes opilio]|uniref:Uncharacterized protein n=1 Tax=Chionoecetes opilio TaxID=41210 RepID=A0A8J4XR58_CHIOP|nr:hypothetical protein GWK47_017641 [Chionoecetes opilio]